MLNWKKEWKPFGIVLLIFSAFYFIPFESVRIQGAVIEAFQLASWYAREHVILCLVPAFFIAGAISVFISQGSIIKYLGPQARKVTSYGVASVSGSILAVCSCTVLPLFAGIYKAGAGIGPATAFLYSGPAINVLAIILTARILGYPLGVARAVGAVLFSLIIGLLMHFFFRKEELERQKIEMALPESEIVRPLWQNSLLMLGMVLILIFATWGESADSNGFFTFIHSIKWIITSLVATLLGLMMILWMKIKWWHILTIIASSLILYLVIPDHPIAVFIFAIIGLSVICTTNKGEAGVWLEQSYGFAKQIAPLLLYGVLVAGLLMGRPGNEGLIPSSWIAGVVGGNSLGANLFAAVSGALMYFATLTEIPIIQGLVGHGMGKGPALALLLAGPALSLPNMLVIRSVMGNRKTVVFVLLVVIMATLTGKIYGYLDL